MSSRARPSSRSPPRVVGTLPQPGSGSAVAAADPADDRRCSLDKTGALIAKILIVVVSAMLAVTILRTDDEQRARLFATPRPPADTPLPAPATPLPTLPDEGALPAALRGAASAGRAGGGEELLGAGDGTTPAPRATPPPWVSLKVRPVDWSEQRLVPQALRQVRRVCRVRRAAHAVAVVGPVHDEESAAFRGVCRDGVHAPRATMLWHALLSAGRCSEKRGVGRPVFVDVGADIGYFSILAARMGCRVVAAEADPLMLPYVAATLARATDDATNIDFFSAAVVQYPAADGVTNVTSPRNVVGGTAASMAADATRLGSGWVVPVRSATRLHDAGLVAPTVALEDLLAPYRPRPRWLRIAVRHRESDVLATAKALIHRRAFSVVVLEVSNENRRTAPGVARTCPGNQFRCMYPKGSPADVLSTAGYDCLAWDETDYPGEPVYNPADLPDAESRRKAIRDFVLGKLRSGLSRPWTRWSRGGGLSPFQVSVSWVCVVPRPPLTTAETLLAHTSGCGGYPSCVDIWREPPQSPAPTPAPPPPKETPAPTPRPTPDPAQAVRDKREAEERKKREEEEKKRAALDKERSAELAQEQEKADRVMEAERQEELEKANALREAETREKAAAAAEAKRVERHAEEEEAAERAEKELQMERMDQEEKERKQRREAEEARRKKEEAEEEARKAEAERRRRETEKAEKEEREKAAGEQREEAQQAKAVVKDDVAQLEEERGREAAG